MFVQNIGEEISTKYILKKWEQYQGPYDGIFIFNGGLWTDFFRPPCFELLKRCAFLTEPRVKWMLKCLATLPIPCGELKMNGTCYLLVATPFIASQTTERWTFERLAGAINFLVARFDPPVIGLGGYTSGMVECSPGLLRLIDNTKKTRFVSGTTLTVGNVISAIDALKEKEFDKKANVGIIGATGAIGGSLAHYLMKNNKVNRLTLIGRSHQKLKRMRDALACYSGWEYLGVSVMEEKHSDDFRKVDIVVIALSGATKIVASEFAPDAIFIDISVPSAIENLEQWQRLYGCFMKPIHEFSIDFDFQLPRKDLILSCLAETTVRYDKSLLGRIDSDDITAVSYWAQKLYTPKLILLHGLEEEKNVY